MDHYPELSLGNSSTFSESDESLSKKRKYQPNNDDNSTISSTTESSVFATMMSNTPELQPKQNYLSDFHDLQFGRRYNLSKNPIMMKKKSCNNDNWQHKHQKLDLELSLSNSDDDDARSSKSSEVLEDLSTKSSSISNMVAMGCLKCNLLVMVSKSFPSCPNCKFVNSIPKNHYYQSPPRKVAKSLHTLSLLH
ncbi:uncharacterized protein LOC113278359 [Papaver somniferum]|uniref:uncharacterized protein LOC113278359 n=1 Tax=Papaver somniferum TaxID=3469 RepID=UPI000E700361|nr:uncharacterized protein LOC113278359 [Papaver somniferum]